MLTSRVIYLVFKAGSLTGDLGFTNVAASCQVSPRNLSPPLQHWDHRNLLPAFYRAGVLVSILSTPHKLVSYLGIETSTEKKPQSDYLQASLQGIPLISDLFGSTQPIVGRANPGQVILCGIRKLSMPCHGEQASKQASSIISVSVPASSFQP